MYLSINFKFQASIYEVVIRFISCFLPLTTSGVFQLTLFLISHQAEGKYYILGEH